MQQANSTDSVATQGDVNKATQDYPFQFVQRLAAELSERQLDLPGFPDIVVRLHRELSNENGSLQNVAGLLIREPVLVARLLALANSAAFNANGRTVSNVRAAVTLLGFNIVRSASTAFAVSQMRQQPWLEPLHDELARCWRESNEVAATCFVAAQRLDGVRADEAMVAGLFHQMGRLYMLTRALRDGLDPREDEWTDVLTTWQPTIGRAIVENWDLGGEYGEAIECQDQLEHARELPMLARLVAGSKHACALLREQPPGADWATVLNEDPQLAAVGLEGKSLVTLVNDGREKIDLMQSALGA